MVAFTTKRTVAIVDLSRVECGIVPLTSRAPPCETWPFPRPARSSALDDTHLTPPVRARRARRRSVHAGLHTLPDDAARPPARAGSRAAHCARPATGGRAEERQGA